MRRESIQEEDILDRLGQNQSTEGIKKFGHKKENKHESSTNDKACLAVSDREESNVVQID